jgi:hypothetical protein
VNQQGAPPRRWKDAIAEVKEDGDCSEASIKLAYLAVDNAGQFADEEKGPYVVDLSSALHAIEELADSHDPEEMKHARSLLNLAWTSLG